MNNDSRSFEDQLSSLKEDVAVIRSNYVTKADLQEVRIELKGEIQAARTELQTGNNKLGTEFRAEISELRLEIEKLRVEMRKFGADIQTSLQAQTWKMYGFGAVLVTAVHFVTRAGY